MAKKLGDQYIVGPPTQELEGPVSSGPHGCWAYGTASKSEKCKCSFLRVRP